MKLHVALGRREERADRLEERRLAAARRPDDRDELARPDVERDLLNGQGAVGVTLLQLVDIEERRLEVAMR